MDIKDKLPATEIDPELLKIVFENIILNAFEAMPDGGKLKITAETKTIIGQKNENEKSLIEISFEDSGKGIPLTDIDSVFDPYFTTKELGTLKKGAV